MLLFQNKMHVQRVILVVLLYGSAVANASVDNLPSISVLVHKVVLRGVNDNTQNMKTISHPKVPLWVINYILHLQNVWSLTVHAACSWCCANNPTYPIILHTSQVSWGILESAPALSQVLLLTSAPLPAGEVLAMRHTTVICISSHLRSYTSSENIRAKSNHCHKILSIQLIFLSSQTIFICGCSREIM